MSPATRRTPLRGQVRPRKRAPWGSLAVLAVVAAAGLLLGACGGAPSADKSSSKTPPTTGSTTTTTAPAITTSTVVIDGKSVEVPTDDGTSITSLQDAGQNVVLTTKGFLPRTLYSARAATVIYTNLTPKTVTITFLHVPHSPPATIAPGASYSYTPRYAMQYEYKSSTGDSGYVVVGAFTS